MSFTHSEMLRQCGKAVKTASDSRMSKTQIESELPELIDTWLKQTHILSDDLLGFVFPQTEDHEPIVISRLLMSPARKRTSSSSTKSAPTIMTDVALQYISKRIIEQYHASKDKAPVSWSWSILETYVQKFFNEYMESKEQKVPKVKNTPPLPKVRIGHTVVKTAKTVHVNKFATITDPSYALVTDSSKNSTLQTIHQLALDHTELKQVISTMKYETTKFKESIVRNVESQQSIRPFSDQYFAVFPPPQASTSQAVASNATTKPNQITSVKPMQSTLPSSAPKPVDPSVEYTETIAIQAKNAPDPVEITYKIRPKQLFSTVRIPYKQYVSNVRVRQARQPAQFETLLNAPMKKSVDKHPFYLFLRNELQSCREEQYKSVHPNEPTTVNSLKVTLGKRKRDGDDE